MNPPMPSPVTHLADPEFSAQLSSLQPRLRGFVFTLLGSTDAADDVAQNTNRVLWTKRAEFVAGTNFTAWAFKIATFEVRSYLRRQGREQRGQVPAESVLDQIADRAAEHHGDVASESRRAAMTECLQKMRPHDRQLITQRYLQSTPLSTIAEANGLKQNAMAQKFFRLRGSLLKCIRKQLARVQRTQAGSV